MHIGEVKALPSDQLQKELQTSYEELVRLRFRWATKQLQNAHEMTKVRRKIAQIKTVLRERQS